MLGTTTMSTENNLTRSQSMVYQSADRYLEESRLLADDRVKMRGGESYCARRAPSVWSSFSMGGCSCQTTER